MAVAFLDLSAQHRPIEQELRAAMGRVLASDWFILGEEVEAFEAEFASYCGVRHCIGVGNGLDALRLTLEGLGIGVGDEVIVPAQTFIATWLAVTEVGARPIPVDVEWTTGNLDPERVEAAITSRCKAILPVHLFGNPAAMPALADIAERHQLFLIEDAAQAHGAKLNRWRIGGDSIAATFSFFPAKNLGAIGDAGAVITNSDALADQLKLRRNYGSRVKYQHEIKGLNSRLDALQAAILRVKLRHLDSWNAHRRQLADAYRIALGSLNEVILPVETPETQSVWHLFPVRVPERDRMIQRLADAGIGTLIHYPHPPHLTPAFADLGFKPGDFPAAEAWAAQELSLPMGPHLTAADIEIVAAAVRDILQDRK